MTHAYLVAAFVVVMPVLTAAQQSRVEPTVVTSGVGVLQVVPDRAWVTITAESRASNPRDAQRRNADAMTPVQQKLRAAGIAADALRTIVYDLQPEWDYVSNRRVLRGYVARNTIEARVDAVDRVGEVLEIAVGSGATALGGVRFDLKDRSGLEREALRLAVADARAKADAAAAGVGQAVSRVLRIEEQAVESGHPLQAVAAAREAIQSGAPPISAGQLELQARVTMTVELK